MIRSGFMIKAAPGKLDKLQQEIAIYDSVELDAIIDEEKMLIVMHCFSEQEKNLLSKEIEQLESVLGMHFVYDCYKNLCNPHWEYPPEILPAKVGLKWIDQEEV